MQEALCKQKLSTYLLAASTSLDIRFKNLVFCDPGNVETIKTRLVTEMQDPGSCDGQTTTSESSITASTSCVGTVTQESPAANTETSREDYGRSLTHVWRSRENAHQTLTHIEMFQTWKKKWSKKQGPFGLLGKKIEHMPSAEQSCTKTPCDCVNLFSSREAVQKAGETIGHRWNRLKVKHFNMLLFMNTNLKLEWICEEITWELWRMWNLTFPPNTTIVKC